MVTVSVEVSAVVLLIVTEDEERLHVAGLVALDGVLVTAQVSVTVPVNEFDGVTVMVEVPVEPGATVIEPLLLRAKLVLELGACQKFPQPLTKGTAASNNHAHFPIFISAPRWQLSPPAAPSRTRYQGIA